MTSTTTSILAPGASSDAVEEAVKEVGSEEGREGNEDVSFSTARERVLTGMVYARAR